MEPFGYSRASSWDGAVEALAADRHLPLGGGTDLIPLLREGRAVAAQVVDLRAIPGAGEIVAQGDGSLRIGAAVTLRSLATDARVRADFPVLADACHAVGSFALRHMGTIGGNLCQRMRCWYFRQGHECLRLGGSQCSAEIGENQYHAIFRQGPCVAVHPSDPAVALVALDAVVHVQGPASQRDVSAAKFLAPSRTRLDGETTLAAHEVVTGITLPAHAAGGLQYFEKVMQRGAWDFALVSVAAVKRRDDEVRLVLGGVANTPVRVVDSIEEDVASGGLADADIETLAQRALYDAEPLSGNGYKVDVAAGLLRRAIARLVA